MYYCFADVFCKDTFSVNSDLLTFKNADRLLYDSQLSRVGNEIYKNQETVSLYYDFIVKVLIEDVSYWKNEIKNKKKYWPAAVFINNSKYY